MPPGTAGIPAPAAERARQSVDQHLLRLDLVVVAQDGVAIDHDG